MASVFISHRGTDANEAERLAAELRTRGHDIRLDEWDLGIGDSIVEWMDHGLTSCSYVILCYSSIGVDAPWVNREWMPTLARQLDGHNVKLLPARLTGGVAPAILADIKYADLVSDWNRGVCELLRAII